MAQSQKRSKVRLSLYIPPPSTYVNLSPITPPAFSSSFVTKIGNLHITSLKAIQEIKDELPENAHVISFVPCTLPEKIDHHIISLSDNELGAKEMADNLDWLIEMAFKWMDADDPIYIHCYAGASRSVACAIAFLMAIDWKNGEEILPVESYHEKIVMLRQNPINPRHHLATTEMNFAFLDMLIKYRLQFLS